MPIDSWLSLVAIWVAYVTAALVPGPNVLVVVQAAMAHGASRGLAMAGGTAMMAGIWMTFSALGIAALAVSAPLILDVMYGVGGGWLMWLGVPTLVRALSGAQPERSKLADVVAPAGTVIPLNAMTAFGRGAVVAATNPKGLLFFVSVATLAGGAAASPLQLGLLVGVTASLSMIVYGLWAICFSRSYFRVRYHQSERFLNMAFGAVFTAFGGWLWLDLLLAWAPKLIRFGAVSF